MAAGPLEAAGLGHQTSRMAGTVVRTGPRARLEGVEDRVPIPAICIAGSVRLVRADMVVHCHSRLTVATVQPCFECLSAISPSPRARSISWGGPGSPRVVEG